uniref:Rapid alkalinization factor-like n=1 Tax=Nelumbo nucifera TaxID=4432 RepID=A0A822XVF2_NELNU|nr:TPA_asm: hypothetical protein HUJ06_024604 [Nelumbo nucifera]
MTVATSSGFFVMIVVFVTALLISSSTTVDANGEYRLGWLPTRSTYQGSMEECMAGGNDYGALQHNTVPCSRRRASYYNYKPGAQANPYNRGCSAITRCRS